MTIQITYQDGRGNMTTATHTTFASIEEAEAYAKKFRRLEARMGRYCRIVSVEEAE